MTGNLSKKTALITGGVGGIGLAIANKFADNGITVAVSDIHKPKKSPTLFFRCDVRKARQIHLLYQWTLKNIGVPDILILNAGVGIKEKLYEGDPEKWQKVVDVNLMGALRCIRAFVPQMMERQSGSVLFISSVSANQPHIYGGIYSASKTALDVVAETLRMETMPHLHVTTISPGATDTGFFKNQVAGASASDDFLPFMDAEEVAEDVFYAISKNGNRCINKIVTRPLAQQF